MIQSRLDSETILELIASKYMIDEDWQMSPEEKQQVINLMRSKERNI